MNLIAGRYQRRHPRAAFGFDSDHNGRLFLVLAQVFADHRVQPGDSRYPFGQLRPAQDPPGLILHLHIVMLLSPVIPQEQQLLFRSTMDTALRQPTEDPASDLINKCSRQEQRARHPISGLAFRPTGRGTICQKD